MLPALLITSLLSKPFLQALHVTSITYNKPFIKTFFAGAPCYQHSSMPPAYRPPVYGMSMMPPQQCPYQPGMDYNMTANCPPPPYPGTTYVPYDLCQQAHSNLNPFAEPFIVPPHQHPGNQQYCYYPEDHRCISQPYGQVKRDSIYYAHVPALNC